MNFFRILFLSLLFLVNKQTLFAQTDFRDQLRIRLEQEKIDSNKVNIMNELAFNYIFSIPDSAIRYADLGLRLAEKIKFKHGIADALNNIGILHRAEGSYKSAIEYHLKALAINEAINDKLGVANNYINIGLVYYAQENAAKAIEYYYKCLKIKEELNDKEGVANALNDMGNIYVNVKNYEKALEFYKNALKIRYELNDPRKTAWTIKSMGMALSHQKNYEEALKYLDQALPFYEQAQDQHGIAEIFNLMANVFFSKNETLKSIFFYEKSVLISNKFNYKLLAKDSFKGLSNAYKKQNNKSKAFDYLEQYTILQDTLFSVETTQKVAQMQAVFENNKKQIAIELLAKDNENQKLQRNAVIIGFALLALLIFVLVRNNKREQLNNAILKQQYVEIRKNKEEIGLKNEQIELFNKSLEEKNRKMTDSIRYAQTIQQSILPREEELKQVFEDYFAIYLPRDIVSGDFYWLDHSPDYNMALIALADCTGHGVPGALMSMIGGSTLDEIAHTEKVFDPALILDKLNVKIRQVLKQDSKASDGMDIAICKIERIDGKNLLTFAGAKRAIYHFDAFNHEFNEIKGTKKSIGGLRKEENKTFVNVEIYLQKDDVIYLTTDGMADQTNDKKEKFSSQKVKSLLFENAHLKMSEQKQIFMTAIKAHMKDEEQRDDISILAIKI
ncbi:MAG: hypothetical protein EAZ97_06915 [Bacteroidetes bacterium]|nr:MAG: hypothetical protein EAZ97_06915 [Bacteroidota bacterium]